MRLTQDLLLPRSPQDVQEPWSRSIQELPNTPNKAGIVAPIPTNHGTGKRKETHGTKLNPSSETSPFPYKTPPFHAGTWLQRHLVLPGIQHTQEQQEEPSPNTTTRAQRKRGRPCPKPGGTNLRVRDEEMLLFQGFGQ